MERYYLPEPEEDLLGTRESDHALRVMRHREGDRIALFDGAGMEWIAEVTGRRGRQLAFRRIAERRVAPPPWRIAIAAAKQSGRAWLPTIHAPIGLGALGRESSSYPLRLFGSLHEGAPPLRSLLTAHRKEAERGVLSLIGPEGDLTPAERTYLEDAGFLPVSLSPTVLRAETAALFCAAAFLYELADEGSGRREEGVWQKRL